MNARVRREYDADGVSRLVSVDTGKDGGAQQSFAKECDINEIVRRFNLTGELPAPREPGQYGDFSAIIDFQSAQEQLVAAREAFEALPAEVREDFGYDAALFVDWVTDPANVDEARKRGLVAPVPELPADSPVGGVSVPSGASE